MNHLFKAQVFKMLFLGLIITVPAWAQKAIKKPADRKDLVTVNPQIDTTNYRRVVFVNTNSKKVHSHKQRKPKKYIYNMDDRSLKPYPYGRLQPSQVTLRRSLPGQKSDDLGLGLRNASAPSRAPASLPTVVGPPSK